MKILKKLRHTAARNGRTGSKRWILIGCLSIVFGIVCIVPHLWQRMETTYPFHGIEIMGTDQENYYAARIREVDDGYPMLGSVYYGDDKNLQYIQPPLPEWVEATLGRIFFLDAARTVVFVKFVFGALLFAAMTIFCIGLSGSVGWSLAAVSAVLFSGFVFSAPHVVLQLLQGTLHDGEFLRFSRPTNPQFSSLLFFLALLFFQQWIKKPRFSWAIATGIVTGLSFYSYPYTWSYLGLTFAVAVLVYAYRRDWRAFRQLLVLALVTGIVALPFWIHHFAVVHHPAYPAIMQRFVVLATHAFVPGWWMFIFLGLALLNQWQKILTPTWLVWALAIAGIVAMEQQIVTGTMVLPQHYHWYFIQPLAAMTLVLLLGIGVVNRFLSKRVGLIILTLGIVVSVILGVLYQRASYDSQRLFWGKLQSTHDVLNALRRVVKPGTVTYASDYLRELIPIYTSGDVYDATNAMLSLVPDQRPLQNYFFELWLRGVTLADVQRSFPDASPRGRRYELSSRIHGLYYREQAGDFTAIPESEVRNAINGYRAFLALPLSQKLHLYKLDYLALPTNAIPDTPAMKSVLEAGRLVYDDPSYMVWGL